MLDPAYCICTTHIEQLYVKRVLVPCTVEYTYMLILNLCLFIKIQYPEILSILEIPCPNKILQCEHFYGTLVGLIRGGAGLCVKE